MRRALLIAATALAVAVLASAPSAFALTPDAEVSNRGNSVGVHGIDIGNLVDRIHLQEGGFRLDPDDNDVVVNGDGYGHVADSYEDFEVAFTVDGGVGFALSLVVGGTVVRDFGIEITYRDADGGVVGQVSLPETEVIAGYHYYSSGNLDSRGNLVDTDLEDLVYTTSWAVAEVTVHGRTGLVNDVQLGVVFDHWSFGKDATV